MKTINVVNGPQNVSAIVQGCMRMVPLSVDEAAKDPLFLMLCLMKRVCRKDHKVKETVCSLIGHDDPLILWRCFVQSDNVTHARGKSFSNQRAVLRCRHLWNGL